MEELHHQHQRKENANGAHCNIMIHGFGSYAVYQRQPNAKVILYSNSGNSFLFQHAGVVETAS